MRLEGKIAVITYLFLAREEARCISGVVSPISDGRVGA
jgi:hypothetical protein